MDIIDEEFIHLMNEYVQNIAMYVNPNIKINGSLKIKLDEVNDKSNAKD